MQLLIDEFAGRESDFTKKLVIECNKKERKDILAKAQEEKKNAKKLPNVLKEDKEPSKDPGKEPDPKELSCE